MKRYDPTDDEKDDLTLIERHKVVLSIVAVGLISTGVYTLQGIFSHPSSSQNKALSIVSVRLPPPPPTPPPAAAPTPPPQEIKEEKMVAQERVEENEEKPDDKPPEAAPVTTGIAGNGSDAFGLKAGNGSGNYFGNGKKQRTPYGWYATQVQGTIADTLRKTPGARNAQFSVKVRIWSDVAGRVTRAKLANSAGDPKLDAAIQQALGGIQLKEPPPAGMPMPIVLRISGQRPNSL